MQTYCGSDSTLSVCLQTIMSSRCTHRKTAFSRILPLAGALYEFLWSMQCGEK